MHTVAQIGESYFLLHLLEDGGEILFHLERLYVLLELFMFSYVLYDSFWSPIYVGTRRVIADRCICQSGFKHRMQNKICSEALKAR